MHLKKKWFIGIIQNNFIIKYCVKNRAKSLDMLAKGAKKSSDQEFPFYPVLGKIPLGLFF